MPHEPEDRARARLGAVLNDKWTLERLLGTGGMATVYAAKHRNGARAAVKILHQDLVRHEQVRERFLREGYAANKVEHSGVVKVLDDDTIAEGPDEGSPYIVMELLDGESLEERRFRPPPVSEVEFLTIAESVLGVLEAAHARGVIHRDLKPENLLLVKDPEGEGGKLRVKVLDFGLARLQEAAFTTAAGLALGTPSFMSPEQAAGKTDEIDGRTDLFSLAATGYQLLADRRIHEGDNPIELVTKMAKLPAPPIRSVAPYISEPFARIIDKALSFAKEDRYATAGEMRADVARAIQELEATEKPPAVVPKPPVPIIVAKAPPTIELSASDLEPAEASRRVTVPRARRSRVVEWLGALLVLCAGVGAVYALSLREPREETKGIAEKPADLPVVGTSGARGPPTSPLPSTMLAMSETSSRAKGDAAADARDDAAEASIPDAESCGRSGGDLGDPRRRR